MHNIGAAMPPGMVQQLQSQQQQQQSNKDQAATDLAARAAQVGMVGQQLNQRMSQKDEPLSTEMVYESLAVLIAAAQTTFEIKGMLSDPKGVRKMLLVGASTPQKWESKLDHSIWGRYVGSSASMIAKTAGVSWLGYKLVKAGYKYYKGQPEEAVEDALKM